MLHLVANVAVAAAGTAVKLAAARKAAAWVNVQALSTNAGAVYIGDSSVTNSSGSSWGVRLLAGDALMLEPIAAIPYDLATIFVNADTNADKVSVLYMTT